MLKRGILERKSARSWMRSLRAFGFDFAPQGRLDGMLAVIAWKAVELLESDEVSRERKRKH
jgi:hypothetical protein